jgi:Ca2+-binding RTX toxin-like protein
VAAGTYTVSLTVSDGDESATQSSSITITGTANTTTLAIQGTAGNDNITVSAGLNGALIVNLNGAVSTHSGITQIVINAGAGNDKIKVKPEVTQSTVVFAGDGDDMIKTGSGDDIIVGGNGDDLIHGNDGRDILIGGRGRDRIVGNADSDILVAAYTTYGPNLAALTAIQSEWTSARSFGQRTANVMGRDVTIGGVKYFFAGPRNNGDTFFATDGPHATVFDDGDVDILSGNSEQDLFLFNSDTCVRDILTDLGCNDFAADIDFLSDADSPST